MARDPSGRNMLVTFEEGSEERRGGSRPIKESRRIAPRFAPHVWPLSFMSQSAVGHHAPRSPPPQAIRDFQVANVEQRQRQTTFFLGPLSSLKRTRAVSTPASPLPRPADQPVPPPKGDDKARFSCESRVIRSHRGHHPPPPTYSRC
ncbi:hypothetical protein BDK51DRAFT_47561 [Blyttiomyces helicus]|uniref:Uncharacterized protein n=1 Tax=Blyttiomyces helicus TaxID=388810 RepID=A0A4P9VYT4_9FUNG|nr:hypothetical protein BDK51DRAFT_47561 [Blyttiomyces helicus]|eukprot:RKO84442.1 hypothetical protein BDK51DRAFT_47561 [Blyttiomyces helicus]